VKISFIVSAFNRPESLKLCLQSLILQTETDWEAIVMDNAADTDYWMKHYYLCRHIDKRIIYIRTPIVARKNCYFAADFAVRHLPRGEWLCFPSDDSYYVPTFAAKMLQKAAKDDLQFVYCDFVWGRKFNGEVSHTWCESAPAQCRIDKTTFLIRHECMISWPQDPEHYYDSYPSDGLLAEEMVRRGVRTGRVEETLVVHN
jgi:glycosyltransferase involved in cell wall biosynthesis